MKITNKSSRTLEIAATGQQVGPGEAVEVDETLGRSLCEQSDVWAKTKSKAGESGDKSEEG